MLSQLSPFLRRPNSDGTIDSICTCCFQTIATCSDEGILATVETIHLCTPSALAARVPKGKWKQDEAALP